MVLVVKNNFTKPRFWSICLHGSKIHLTDTHYDVRDFLLSKKHFKSFVSLIGKAMIKY